MQVLLDFQTRGSHQQGAAKVPGWVCQEVKAEAQVQAPHQHKGQENSEENCQENGEEN